jgi:hypothetical protein
MKIDGAPTVVVKTTAARAPTKTQTEGTWSLFAARRALGKLASTTTN